jgi:hypothetical protein
MWILDIIGFLIITSYFFVKTTIKVKLFSSSLLSAYCLYNSYILAETNTGLALFFFILGVINVKIAFSWLDEINKKTC